ncbi:hypothetical protein AB5I41_14360 [Sphingomonas sp. MMS24-JH45]
MPDGTSRVIADARYGSFNGVRLRGVYSFALTDTLSAGVSALYRRADGWQTAERDDVDYGDEDAASGRLQLRWRPGGGADVLLAVDGRHQRQNGQPHNTIATNPAAPFPAFYGIFFGPCCELTPLIRIAWRHDRRIRTTTRTRGTRR